MITDLNESYTALINSISSTSAKKASGALKGIQHNLFTTKLKNSKKTDTDFYVKEIENCYPGTKVTIKSMTSDDVKNYYENWKKQPINYSAFSHNITVSPKVLEKMKSDPDYAEKMLSKIKSAATPVGFENATLYEYKVIVRDDGQIEVMACADFMNGKNQRKDNDEDNRKKDLKRFNPIYFNRTIQDQLEEPPLSTNEITTNQLFDPQYAYIAQLAARVKRENSSIH